MFESIIGIAVGIVLIVIAIMNMKGNVKMLHSYHIDNIKEEDKIPFGKMVGTGILIVGCGIAIFGALSLCAKLLTNSIFTKIGMGLLIVSILIGVGIALYAIKKYNGKIM